MRKSTNYPLETLFFDFEKLLFATTFSDDAGLIKYSQSEKKHFIFNC